MNTYISTLIPELSEWNNGSGISLETWIGGIGRFDHALGYLSIFWPTFIQYESCVFRNIPDKASYQQWIERANGNIAEVEAVVNHLHLKDLFNNLDFKPNKALLTYLGEVIRQMWSCKLKQDFPEKSFEFRSTLNSNDLSGLELTFYQTLSFMT